MNVARSLADLPGGRPSVVTVGTFDGVHAGHRSILEQLVTHSREQGIRNVVVTFTPHPRTVVKRGPVALLTTLEERLALFAECGVENTLVIEFTFEFSRQSPEEFILNTIVPIGTREMIIGYDHLFGRDREAGTHELRVMAHEHGIDAVVVDPVHIGGAVVSSSSIRRQLDAGDVAGARAALLRPYALTGQVVRGDGRGSTLGFHTANVAVADPEKLVPANGVYAVTASVRGKEMQGMMNIGFRPTFERNDARTLEVHLFDFSETLYGESITVRFYQRLRDERKFSSAEELVRQLRMDRDQARTILQELSLSSVH